MPRRHFGNQWVRTHTDEQRFWARVDRAGPDECWLWTGPINYAGYGYFGTGSRLDDTRRSSMAHRFSHELHIGPIPAGFHVDHLCRVRRCVAPHHLEAVTPSENARRALPYSIAASKARMAARRYCVNGHDQAIHGRKYAHRGDNLTCLVCKREHERENARRYRERRRRAKLTTAQRVT